MTLGSWFKEYVYIPLGGNRKGFIKTIRNLMIVWLLTGIWHGAGYNFILWGAVLFIILVIEKFFIGKWLHRYSMAGHLYMFIIIPLTWAVFAIDDIGRWVCFYKVISVFIARHGVDFSKWLHKILEFILSVFLLRESFFSTKIPFQLLKRSK